MEFFFRISFYFRKQMRFKDRSILKTKVNKRYPDDAGEFLYKMMLSLEV